LLLCTRASNLPVAVVVVDSRLPFLAPTRVLPLSKYINQVSHWRLLQHYLGRFDEERRRFCLQVRGKFSGVAR